MFVVYNNIKKTFSLTRIILNFSKLHMSDYEIIDNDPISEEISQHIPESNSPSLLYSDVENSNHSQKSVKLEKNTISQIKFDDSHYGNMENLDEIKESIKKSLEIKANDGQDLFMKIFKEHYYVAVFGVFSLYQAFSSLLAFLNDKLK